MSRSGLWFALGAYGLWGLLPVYWKFLVRVPSVEILLHRMVWSLVFLAVVLGVWRQVANRGGSRAANRMPSSAGAPPRAKTVLLYLLAAVLLSVNWWIYIYAVNAGFIVETSLGYFINPLVSVFLGVVLFRERLRGAQWIAIALAASGVAYLTWAYGQIPWISLALAFSFACYAVIKKIAPLGALEGLTLETALMSLPAVAVLVYWQKIGSASFLSLGTGTDVLLIGSGAATAIPLLFFAAAARRLSLSAIGIMQYIAPTIQFLLGVAVYGELFNVQRAVGFSLIWTALALFTVDGWRHRTARTLAGTSRES